MNQQTDSNLSAGSHHSGGSDEQPLLPQVQYKLRPRLRCATRCVAPLSALHCRLAFVAQTPEKNRTATNERKRKRKTTSVDHNDNSGQGGQGASKSLKNDKKISEYFKVSVIDLMQCKP